MTGTDRQTASRRHSRCICARRSVRELSTRWTNSKLPCDKSHSQYQQRSIAALLDLTVTDGLGVINRPAVRVATKSRRRSAPPLMRSFLLWTLPRTPVQMRAAYARDFRLCAVPSHNGYFAINAEKWRELFLHLLKLIRDFQAVIPIFTIPLSIHRTKI